jgi:Cu2+-exporting ATPase
MQDRVKEEIERFSSGVQQARRIVTLGVARSREAGSEIYRDVADEITFAAEEAGERLISFRDRELRPIWRAIRREWRALTATIAEDQSAWGRATHAVIQYLGRVAVGLTESLSALWPRARAVKPGETKRASPLQARTLWQSFRCAKELIVSDRREAQLEEIAGSQARAAIRQAEAAVNHYLTAAAIAMCISAAGVLLFSPLLWVAALLICYVAYPAVKSGYLDLVEKGKLSIRVLDSICFAGLLLGGFILICSITAFIFHSSAKLMLKTEDRSRKLIADLFGEQPRTVLVLENGQEVERPFESLTTGDLLVVHAGQMIPVDGEITEGTAAVDQHVLTGEAQPAEKGIGDSVFAATVQLAGRIVMRVSKTGAETAAAQIRDLLANTIDFRDAIQARWQDVADQTVLPTVVLTLLAWALLGPIGALAILCSNYVAVMKIASPLSMLSFLQRAAQSGVLVKDGRTLEMSSKVDAVVFDKTGTLTLPQPHVGAVHAFSDIPADHVLRLAAAVEANQSHPIAQAIMEEFYRCGLELPVIEQARYDVGYGIRASVDGREVCVGSARYMAMEGIGLPTQFRGELAEAQVRGASVVYVAVDQKVAGAIELQPTLRPEAREVTAALKRSGLELYIISGDQAAPTQALAAEVGIDNYFAEVLPQDKSLLVERMQKGGRHVCFVGDGINDAIALKSASVSVSLRGASSLAMNTAQIILMDQSLRQLVHVFELAYDYDANLRTLLMTTFLPGVASMAGVFILGAGPGIALLFFNLSMIAGLLNAVWPAVQNLPPAAGLSSSGVAFSGRPAQSPMPT